MGGIGMLENISTEELRKELDKRMAANSKTKKRYEITGEWSGYNSSQRRIVHRECTTNKAFVEKIKELGRIYYTDGTSLVLRVRELAYRERKQKDIKTYSSLIGKCIAQGTNRVAELKE